MDKLTNLLVDQQSNASIEAKLADLLALVRKHLDMDVAFISEFINDERVFKVVDNPSENQIVKVGNADPINETYCQKITDDKLSPIITNTNANPITKAMPVTEKLGIGAYIGVPINLSNGKLYVTFCCYKSHHDESLNDRDLSFLNIISEIATGLIEKNLSKSISRNHAKSAIEQIISDNDISIYFQPIFSLKNNKVAGFESLARFFTTPYKTPDVWFKEAKKVGLNETLEMLAIKNAVTNIAKFNNSTYIAINCSPSHILSGALENTLQNIDCTRLVLEITEHSPISDYEKMRTSLTPLRKRGLRLAIDDVGAGFSSFQHILELEADIVAEGIETEEELNSLRKLNVDSVQGYFIGRPTAINDALSLLNATLPA